MSDAGESEAKNPGDDGEPSVPKMDADVLLERIELLVKSDPEKKKLDVLYNCLDILDSKASSLLTFNAILAAVFTLLLDKQIKGEALPDVAEYLDMLGLFLTLGSTVICLLVAYISWKFFKNLSTASKPTIDVELKALARAVERRTFRYRWAWWLSVLATGSLVFALLARAVYLSPHADFLNL